MINTRPGSRRLEAGTQTRGKGPRHGGRNPEPGSQKLEMSARSLGHQTPLSIVLGCTRARPERIHSLIGDVWPGESAIILDSTQTRGIEFLQTPGRTPASGSPLEGTPVPRIPTRRNPGSPLWSFPGLVPGSPPSSGKWKTSDKENLPYLTYSNRLRHALGRLYKGNLNPKARDQHFET
ncbi:hypothetical protein F2Q69_00042226 [Brassica cretica]|uniref:Uncharacterized protein n=1 Tax=Brassica cretica TaxID=69181 RepID=A0A8S9NDN5_BRACR|nr:hypothetical protein F2Q69_00042226 [Brassica cretica]